MAVNHQEKSLVVRDRFKDLLDQLGQFPKDKFNQLVPAAAQEFSPLYRPVFTVVTIDQDPAAKEVYSPPGVSGAFALHATALQRIANALGIDWENINVTGPELYLWHGQGAGWVTHPTGERIRIPASYTLDARDGSPVAQRAGTQLQSIRQFGAQRAETGVMSRIIRKAAGMKSTYTAAELAKPFVAVLWRPDESDPEVHAALLDRIRYRDAQVFGKRDAGHQADLLAPGGAQRAIDAKVPDREEDAGHGDEATEFGEQKALPQEPPVVRPEEPKQQVLPQLDPDVAAVAQIRLHLEAIRSKLTWQDRPWTKGMREKSPTEKQTGMVAGMVEKALAPAKLTDDQLKVARRTILRTLWGEFRDYAELNSDQLSASIDWAREFPFEVRSVLMFACKADPALDDIAREIGAKSG